MTILYTISDLRRAILLSAIVGSWLVSFNQGSAILAGEFGSFLYLKIFLDYCTPFTVSSITGILRNRSDALKTKPGTESNAKLNKTPP